MNISGTVIQKTNKDVLKLTGCLAAIFKFISMTGIYFKYIMCLLLLLTLHVIPGGEKMKKKKS